MSFLNLLQALKEIHSWKEAGEIEDKLEL